MSDDDAPAASDDDAPAATELDEVLGEMASHASESAKEWADAVKTSFTKALGKNYDSDALAKDVAAFWARGVRDMARGWTDLAKMATAMAGLKSTAPAEPEA